MGIKVEGNYNPDAFIIVFQPDGSRGDVYLSGGGQGDSIFIGVLADFVNHLAWRCRNMLEESNRADEAQLSEGLKF